jgi:hypothetical protein
LLEEEVAIVAVVVVVVVPLPIKSTETIRKKLQG